MYFITNSIKKIFLTIFVLCNSFEYSIAREQDIIFQNDAA